MPSSLSSGDYNINDVDVFRSLAGETYDIVEGLLYCQGYRKGEVLFHEGDHERSLIGVIDGRISITKMAEGNKKIALANVRTGMSLGEMSLIEDAPRSATAHAMGRLVVVRLTVTNFDLLCSRHPAIGLTIQQGMLRSLSMRLRRTSAQYVDREAR